MSGFKTTRVVLPGGDQPDRHGQPCLTVYQGPELGREFPLEHGVTRLGREPEMEICIRDSTISRCHLSVTVDDHGGCFLEDAGSTNGSRVNGDPTQSCVLVDGDQIQVGACMLKFEYKTQESKRYTRKLYELATRDPLTGLLNRNAFQDRLQNAWDASLRSGEPIGILLLDLDHFKSINDTWGHGTGDEVLKKVAGVLTKSARKPDIVARYGGEEFIVLLPTADLSEIKATSERLRLAIEALQWCEPGPKKVTASIGGISTPASQEGSHGELISRADSALYEAKESGRNRSCISS